MWPLYRFISVEQMANFNRLVASDFKDTREANFQVFLQEEAKDKLYQEIATDFIPGYKGKDNSRPVMMDPVIRREYEAGWRKLFLKARIELLNDTEVIVQIDSLFEIWNKSPKMVFKFSLN